jgi:hypothetical protein
MFVFIYKSLKKWRFPLTLEEHIDIRVLAIESNSGRAIGSALFTLLPTLPAPHTDPAKFSRSFLLCHNGMSFFTVLISGEVGGRRLGEEAERRPCPQGEGGQW